MTDDTSANVERLRTRLEEEDISWQPVRDYPNATYLPDTLHTIWWQGPTTFRFTWGHNFEFQDRDVEDVIARLRSQQ